jgi:hypothetical protein
LRFHIVTTDSSVQQVTPSFLRESTLLNLNQSPTLRQGSPLCRKFDLSSNHSGIGFIRRLNKPLRVVDNSISLETQRCDFCILTTTHKRDEILACITRRGVLNDRRSATVVGTNDDRISQKHLTPTREKGSETQRYGQKKSAEHRKRQTAAAHPTHLTMTFLRPESTTSPHKQRKRDAGERKTGKREHAKERDKFNEVHCGEKQRAWIIDGSD